MYEDDLINLDDWIRRLKIEYHIFFTGHRKKPPDDLRIRVERLIKKLSESPDLTFSDRFRFNTLIARFYVYRDLWRRTLLSKEIGAEPKEMEEIPPKPGQPTEAVKPPGDAIRISISDIIREGEKVRLLYNALLRFKKAESAETPISYAQFAKYIDTQARGIREKSGCSAVAFTIALEEDTIRFKAAADDS